ncbi:MAG: mechanosensitive ion channel [Parvibaculum sp.]
MFDFEALLREVNNWLIANVFTLSSLEQIAVLVLVATGVYLTSRFFSDHIDRFAKVSRKLLQAADRLERWRLTLLVGLATALIWGAYGIAIAFVWPHEILRIAGSLLSAWVMIRFATAYLRTPGWASLIATSGWLIAALGILGWFEATLEFLDTMAFNSGEFRISVLDFVNTIFLLAVFLVVSTLLVRLIDDRMRRLEGVSPAARVLIIKVLRVVFGIIAFVVALSSVGVDLSVIAVFSGAIGIGLGFGLQKVVSNLISGILLLLDRSLKPGDVIEVGDAYGWIENMGARYLTVATRDGKEYLIPNEDIITQQVINWSYSSNAVRTRIPVGISYGSNVRRAIDLMIQAALDQPRVLRGGSHEPQVRLTEFADSAVALELRVWVADPEQGLVNVGSDIRLAIWDSFHENGIEFPFPQRDLHIASAKGLEPLVDRLVPKD